jgi:hypothetical protein
MIYIIPEFKNKQQIRLQKKKNKKKTKFDIS